MNQRTIDGMPVLDEISDEALSAIKPISKYFPTQKIKRPHAKGWLIAYDKDLCIRLITKKKRDNAEEEMRLKKAWRMINSRAREKNYELMLISRITLIRLNANEKYISKNDNLDHDKKTENLARQLSKQLANDELNETLAMFLPKKFSWETIRLQRLKKIETAKLSEVLIALADKVASRNKEPLISIPRPGDDYSEESMQRRVRLCFIRALADYFQVNFGGTLNTTLATFASIALDQQIGKSDVDNALRRKLKPKTE